MAALTLSHIYDAPPDLVWAAAIDFDLLAQASHGITKFRGLPSGKVQPDQIIRVDVSLFGLLPWQPYEMHLLNFDPVTWNFHSSERGMGVALWEHKLSIIHQNGQSVLIDRLEIEAEKPSMTWAYVKWAQFLYRRRHKPRQQWIKAHLT